MELSLITHSTHRTQPCRARAELKHCALLDGKVVGGMKECPELRFSGPEEVAEDVELKTFVIAGVPELGDEGLVEGTVFRDQQQKDFAAVGEVGRDRGTGLGAHGFDIQSDELAAAAITGFLQHADLVETDTEVGASEVFILIVFEPILIVQVDAAQFVVGQGEGHFVAGIEPRQQGVRAFDQAFDAFRISISGSYASIPLIVSNRRW